MHDIFFFTDIHGAYPLYKAIIEYCKEQDDEAMIIFGGDAIDRGKDGYRIMKELLDNPSVAYLKGNHEDMFAKAARELKEKFSFEGADKERIHKILNACKHFDYKYAAIQDSLYNGGLSTLTDWILDGMPMDLVEKVEKLPLTLSFDGCDFCHASPIYKCFYDVWLAEYEDHPVDPFDAEHVIWSRTAIDAPWTPKHICFFGHTPVSYVPDYFSDMKLDESKEVAPIKWGDPDITGEKLDMDTGAAFTGRAYVINVLTMQAQGFVDTDFENNEIHSHDVKKIECIQF